MSTFLNLIQLTMKYDQCNETIQQQHDKKRNSLNKVKWATSFHIPRALIHSKPFRAWIYERIYGSGPKVRFVTTRKSFGLHVTLHDGFSRTRTKFIYMGKVLYCGLYLIQTVTEIMAMCIVFAIVGLILWWSSCCCLYCFCYSWYCNVISCTVSVIYYYYYK